MTENVTGYLASLAYGAATGSSLPAFGSDSYTALPDIEGLKPPAPNREVVSWKVLDQKAAKKIIGSIEFSSATATLTRAFDSSAQLQMRNDAYAGVPVRRNFRLTHPNTGAEIHYFAGYSSKWETSDITNDDRITISWEITVDGDITIVD